MNIWWIIGASFCYLLLLFAIAQWAEKRKDRAKSFFHSPYIYALSLAVYCSAWTFYGSIGRVETNGMDFLTTYLGPALIAPLYGIVLKKMIRISKTQRISTVADFISARYGKSSFLGALVSIISIFGVVPYISLQIKAIGSSISIMLSQHLFESTPVSATYFISEAPLYITICLAVFILIYGNRHIDSTHWRIGMVTAVAFESVVKLFAFLIAAIFICYGLFDGLGDIFQKTVDDPNYERLFSISEDSSYVNWFSMTILAMFAVLLLPRQFQLGVVENVREKQVDKAMWLFPLYLLLINFFVLPVAASGFLYLGDQNYDADYTLLLLPLKDNSQGIALLVFIGGFSAATGMIIVETIALSVMLSNNLLMPVIVSVKPFKRLFTRNVQQHIRFIRNASIVLVLGLAYAYYHWVAHHFRLSDLGHISFVAIIQFAPALLLGMFWKDASKVGAKAGLLTGFIIWFYTLIIPSFSESGWLQLSLVETGPFGFDILKPEALFGLNVLDKIPHAVFWSLSFNLFAFFIGSIYGRKGELERMQSELFVDVFKYYPNEPSGSAGSSVPGLQQQEGSLNQKEISVMRSLLETFIGQEETTKLLYTYLKQHPIDSADQVGRISLYHFAEQRLSGIIGSASAKVMISSLMIDHNIQLDEVFEIVKESQKLISLNKELTVRTEQLKEATEALASANEQLQAFDARKDEFLYTITHELRTPLTSIRAFSEILHDHQDLDEGQRQLFLHTMITEIERLSRLITEILDLEKLELGKTPLSRQLLQVDLLIMDSIQTFNQLTNNKKLKLKLDIEENLPNNISADVDLLKQVMINLLNNAIKFCDPENGLIAVRVKLIGNKLYFEVEDNGPGLASQYHEKVFDKFYQADNQKGGIGSGLGLAISKEIIERHGGSIYVKEMVSIGTCIVFYIPLDLQHKPIT